FWFQLAGNITSKFAEPGSAPSPEVATEPFTSQYSGVGPAAGTTVADAIVILGTPRALSAAVLQAAHNGTFANVAQSATASPNRKINDCNDPNISARFFMCIPPEQISLPERVAPIGLLCH